MSYSPNLPQTHKHSLTNSRAGFTLIELLIVVTLTIVLMLGASALFMTFLLGNTKTSSIQLLRNEGKYAATQMEFLIRNAVELMANSAGDTCESNMSQIRLKSYDNGITTLLSEQNKIASNSGVYLTSESVELVEGPLFNCTPNPDGLSHFVNFSFTLRRGIPGINQPREITVATFSGSAQIRSY